MSNHEEDFSQQANHELTKTFQEFVNNCGRIERQLARGSETNLELARLQRSLTSLEGVMDATHQDITRVANSTNRMAAGTNLSDWKQDVDRARKVVGPITVNDEL
eukprot:TRINITY_DN729_c0_g1_i2.p1 TRINITY_DN729_c0_g1~~TRINITY_DN729_c0_g1_i2.p1  ORF type:complete len:105 (+),score=10.10 TRINITY_DN729_c0_g1_i2:143-457(+)